MKRNWKSVAAGLALLIGLSGAAFGLDRDHDRDRDRDRDRIRVEQHDRDHDRQIFRDRDNRAWYWDHGHKVYVANPYYGYYGPGHYYGYPYPR